MQAPLDAQSLWRQRPPWHAGGHRLAVDRGSVLRTPQRHVSTFQKAAYGLGAVADLVALWAQPILFTMPFLCAVGDVCAYGLDRALFATRVIRAAAALTLASYGACRRDMLAALAARGAARARWVAAARAAATSLAALLGARTARRPPRCPPPASGAAAAQAAGPGSAEGGLVAELAMAGSEKARGQGLAPALAGAAGSAEAGAKRESGGADELSPGAAPRPDRCVACSGRRTLSELSA